MEEGIKGYGRVRRVRFFFARDESKTLQENDRYKDHSSCFIWREDSFWKKVMSIRQKSEETIMILWKEYL